jgi:hypothetical protein
MVCEFVVDGPDDAVLVRFGRQKRKKFANFEAGNGGWDGAEFASVFRRGGGLHIEGIYVGGPTGQPEKNHRRIITGLLGQQGVAPGKRGKRRECDSCAGDGKGTQLQDPPA